MFVSDETSSDRSNGGWKVARSTLGNERVSIGGGGGGIGDPMFDLLDLAHRYADDDKSALEPIGRLLSERASMRLLNLRSAERAVAGGEPGPEGNVAKLLSAEHSQRASRRSRCASSVPPAHSADGQDAGVQQTEIFARCLTIAGGTSEIVRSQIGERLLGLPRDPLLR